MTVMLLEYGVEWSASRSARFTPPGNEPLVPIR